MMNTDLADLLEPTEGDDFSFEGKYPANFLYPPSQNYACPASGSRYGFARFSC